MPNKTTHSKTAYLAWPLLTLAILAWAAVGLLIAVIWSDVGVHRARATQGAYSSSLSSQVSRLEALFSSTATDSAELSTIASVDPASLADTITNVGQSSGIHVDITDANSVAGAPTVPGTAPTQVFSFIANSTGTFASMMYVETLLESLPAPSSIQELQLSVIPSTSATPAAKPTWQLNAQVRVVTASAL